MFSWCHIICMYEWHLHGLLVLNFTLYKLLVDSSSWTYEILVHRTCVRNWLGIKEFSFFLCGIHYVLDFETSNFMLLLFTALVAPNWQLLLLLLYNVISWSNASLILRQPMSQTAHFSDSPFPRQPVSQPLSQTALFSDHLSSRLFLRCTTFQTGCFSIVLSLFLR